MGYRNRARFTLYLTLFIASTLHKPGDARRIKQRLGTYNVNPDQVTISGFSSGGAQAMQYHFAHSNRISGVGIFSGVPYLYGHDRKREDFFVTEPDKFNITFAVETARIFEDKGRIDPLGNIGKSMVYIYHGTKDSTVYHGSGKAIEKIYSHFNPTMQAELDVMPSEHGMPSDNYGGPCSTINLLHSLVNKCNYNGVFAMFNHLYGGDLKKPKGSIGTVPLNGTFLEFDQTEFLGKKSSMDNIGYIYVPSGCFLNANKTCRLSFALHGCAQSRQAYRDKFARTTGYLEMAELNDIIIVFPQTKMSYYNPRNPSGCWDWMGFSGPEYATKNGPQITAINGMMNRVLGIA